jgi:hypothetical protein
MKRKSLSGPEKKKIAASRGWRCGMCGELLPSCFEIDHQIPLWDGGLDESSNMWALCSGCHSQKTEDETIKRIKRNCKTSNYLTCNLCNCNVSPYFIHKCPKN